VCSLASGTALLHAAATKAVTKAPNHSKRSVRDLPDISIFRFAVAPIPRPAPSVLRNGA
jgi:hypothetical protein